jgi:hypothetical protein
VSDITEERVALKITKARRGNALLTAVWNVSSWRRVFGQAGTQIQLGMKRLLFNCIYAHTRRRRSLLIDYANL